MKHIDAAIIGFGTAGKALGRALAEAGKHVALIEQSDRMYGGACPNVACIPTKALVHAASVSAEIGGEFDDHARRYAAAIDEKDQLVRALRVANYDHLANHPNVAVIDASASFVNSNTLALTSATGVEEIEADELFIDTGSAPNILPIPGADGKRVYTSDALIDMRVLPERLVIIGAGYIGVEFASLYRNFSSDVTIIQDSDEFLPQEDHDLAQAVRAHLESRGINLLLGARVERIEDDVEQALVMVNTAEGARRIPGDVVLLATGRHPNLDGLNPEAAHIELDENGSIGTDEHLRTNVPNIWAMGDVRGEQQFTYLAYDDYRIVASDVLGDGRRTTRNRGAVPSAVFCDPPFARVGMTEQQARAAGFDVRIGKLAGSQIARARLVGKPDGLLKGIVDARTDQLLGAHLFCLEAPEIINIVKVALDAQLPFTVLRDGIFTLPTMAESLNNLFMKVE